jgi:hypothetical protein
MKLTLLQMTQNILSAMNSDNVNSISDTVESLQVAEAIKTAYMNMLDRLSMPEHNQLIQLVPSNDSTQPVIMYLPDACSKLTWLDYFDTNPADGNELQTDQFGSYSHGVNTDLQDNANGWSVASTTTATIGQGTVTFTVPAGNTLITVGTSAYCYPSSYPTDNSYMFGTVTGYSGTNLVIEVTQTTGDGTFSEWTITQNGPASLSYPGYKRVRILSVKDFLNMTSAFNPIDYDVESFELTVYENGTGAPQTFTFYYKNDIQPRHCCVINNYYVVFDSFDNTQDSTLQASKTRGMGWVSPVFQMVDNWTPSIDDQRFSLLLNEAKRLAFLEIKNQPHPLATQEVTRQLAGYQKYKSIANRPSYFNALPDFGRRGGMATLGSAGPGNWGWQ